MKRNSTSTHTINSDTLNNLSKALLNVSEILKANTTGIAVDFNFPAEEQDKKSDNRFEVDWGNTESENNFFDNYKGNRKEKHKKREKTTSKK